MKKIEWEEYKAEEEEGELRLPMKFYEDEFDLWYLHTNFEIKLQDVENIEQVPGVESLDIYSRYRLRIGFGKLFDRDKVKKDVEYMLDSSESLELLADDTKEQVEGLLKTFEETKLWCILILPNGKVITYVGKDDADFKSKSEFFERVQEATGCHLLTSKG